jgi:hypothetical protein
MAGAAAGSVLNTSSTDAGMEELSSSEVTVAIGLLEVTLAERMRVPVISTRSAVWATTGIAVTSKVPPSAISAADATLVLMNMLWHSLSDALLTKVVGHARPAWASWAGAGQGDGPEILHCAALDAQTG